MKKKRKYNKLIKYELIKYELIKNKLMEWKWDWRIIKRTLKWLIKEKEFKLENKKKKKKNK